MVSRLNETIVVESRWSAEAGLQGAASLVRETLSSVPEIVSSSRLQIIPHINREFGETFSSRSGDYLLEVMSFEVYIEDRAYFEATFSRINWQA